MERLTQTRRYPPTICINDGHVVVIPYKVFVRASEAPNDSIVEKYTSTQNFRSVVSPSPNHGVSDQRGVRPMLIPVGSLSVREILDGVPGRIQRITELERAVDVRARMVDRDEVKVHCS